jgi:DNA mismatch repair protein MutS
MAQMWSFVPAQSAHIGIVDAVFTRVGASDNISQGESTFMVEMQEASNILNNLSDRSLVLFDELGRGTSTFDGISIAWAIIEYIHNRPNMRPKTLFATHYHELNEIEGMMSRVHNFNVSAQEIEGKMLFLRKLVPGGSEHSFGIQVAKLAGMPHWIITRSSEVLRSLEAERIEENISESVSSPSVDVGNAAGKKKKTRRGAPEAIQMTLFQLEDPLLVQIRDELLDMDIDNMTPVEALRRLADIKTLLKNY